MNFPATHGARRPHLLIVAVAAAGIATSVLLWMRERSHISRDEEHALSLIAAQITDEVQARLIRIDHTLLGLRGLYAAENGFDQISWDAYLGQFDPRRSPGLNGINFLRRVPRETLSAFLEEARARYSPEFHVQAEPGAQELAIISLQRDYLNRPSRLGADRSQHTQLMTGAQRARRTGIVSITAPMQSSDEPSTQRIFIIAPLYRSAQPLATEALRETAHQGWIAAALDTQTLFEGLHKEIGTTLRFEAFDLGESSQEIRLYSAVPSKALSTPARLELTIPVHDRRWRLQLARSFSAQAADRLGLANQLLLGGLGATGLLLVLIWNLSRTQRTAVALASEMTREIKGREWMLRQAQHIANIGMCTRDNRTGALVRSDEYLRIFGLHPQQSLTGGNTQLLARVHTEDRPQVSAALVAFERGESAPPLIFRLHAIDKTERTILTEQRLLPSEKGEPGLSIAVIQDITERIAADRALAQSHAQLDRLMRVLPGTVYQISRDATGHLTIPFLSEGAGTLFGIPAPALMATPARLFSLFPEAQNGALRESLERSAATLTPWQLDASFQPPGGGRRWVRFNAIPEAVPSAVVWHGVATDISMAKEAEHRLRFTQYAVDHMRDAVAFLSADGERVYVNEETCRLTGYTRAELIGVKIWSTFTSVTPAAYQHLWNVVKRQGTHLFETTLITKNGQSVPVEVGTSHIDFGGLEIVFAIARDISARKAAEKALHSSEERLRFTQFALDHAQDLVSIMDRTGQRIHVNDAFCRFTGKTREQLFTERVWEGVPSFDRQRFQELWDKIKLTGHLSYEINVLTSSGDSRAVETSATFLTFDGREAVCTISRDLAPRRAAEADKKRLEEQLRETQKLESLGVLAGGIAHDFNNLLTGILGNASLARDRLSPDDALNDPLTHIEKASMRAAELCQQMLAYAGKGRFIVEAVDLSTLVDDTAKLLDLSLAHRATLELRLTRELPPVLVDATQMRQIIMNLVLNAAEAVPADQGEIIVTTGRMHVDAAFLAGARVTGGLLPGPGVFLEVSDNGCGMDPTTLSRIFEPFFTTKFTGRGLGLAAVQGIVRSHQGALHVRTAPREGTTFRLVLSPYTGSKTRTAQPFATESTPPVQSSGRVLVVDDEESVRTVIERSLQRIGLVVESVEDGESAVRRVRECSTGFVLILLDFTMPRMNGADTLRAILKLRPDARVIMMSGFSEMEAREHLGDMGIAGFIQKPFDLSTLQARVKQTLLLDSSGAPS